MLARITRFVCIAPLLCMLFPNAAALDWPQVITAEEGELVIYQPQPEALEGNLLTGRAAFQIDLTGRDEPIFGVLWFSSRIDTDRENDRATILDLTVYEVRWPESLGVDEQRLSAVVERAMPAAGFETTLSALASSLESAELVQQSLANLNNDPPAILFAEVLSVLLLFDGEPKLSPIENSGYERVLNVPMAVACREDGDGCWLSSGKFWYQASTPLGPWAFTTSPPQELVENMAAAENSTVQPDRPPAIVVATEPTELIVTDGAPDWTSLEGGELLYVSNTESPWLRHLPTGNMYLLLSGRWFRATETSGPWTFVPSNELPDSFTEIPPASDIGGLRSSVAGTPEADDAIRDHSIPQTAAINRSTTTLSVEYDGDPRFESIDGTDVAYAVNTGAQVLEIDGRYYAVDNGVWFSSASAAGPWIVADAVPSSQIAEIPPSSPVYNTTHVHIYESTPEVVYVGYTPGYLWSFPYYGVPVYGTGWYYPPYYGRWYYPRPPTWGFSVGYNPWTGWNYGLSWSNGFFSFGMSWGGGYGGYYRPWGCCGGWYGGGYRGPVVINTGNINIGNSISVGNRTNIGNRIGNDNRLSNVDRNRNLYNRPENRARKADRSLAQRNLQRARPATGRANNVFADRNGQVARLDGNIWQTRQNGSWSNYDANRLRSGSSNRSQYRSQNRSSGSLNTRDLNRDHQARNRGQMQARNHSAMRSSAGGRRR
jgi:hypothetical protein